MCEERRGEERKGWGGERDATDRRKRSTKDDMREVGSVKVVMENGN